MCISMNFVNTMGFTQEKLGGKSEQQIQRIKWISLLTGRAWLLLLVR